MSADIIQAEYETLDAIASRFMRQAELTQQMENKLRSQVDNLTQTGWEGRGAEAFRQEMESTVLPAWQRLHGALEASHQTTLEITHILRTAEEEAAALFGTDSGDIIDGSPSPESGVSPEQGMGHVNSHDPHSAADKVFSKEYMEDFMGIQIEGQNSQALNQSMEELLDHMRNGRTDMETIGPILDRIATERGIDPSVLREQLPQFVAYWNTAKANGSMGTINLDMHPDYMGSTWSLRYGQVAGEVLGIDPVLAAVLNPTGGIVGPGDTGYVPGSNDAIGYHGTFHDAAGYLYNYQHDGKTPDGRIGPGYDYFQNDPLIRNKADPLAGQIMGISWWAGHPHLNVDVLPNIMPDIPFVPNFIERGIANQIEDGIIAGLRQPVYIIEGSRDIADGLRDIGQGNFREGAGDIAKGGYKAVGGTIRSAWEWFN